MLWKINEHIWFDSDKLFIIKGRQNYINYIANLDKYPSINIKRMRSNYPTIVFLSSMTCNLKCKYCFATAGTYGKKTKKVFFSADEYLYVYNLTLSQYGGINAISFFGGEPILNISEIEKFVEYLHKQYNDIPAMAISSNGTIMNNRIRKFLCKYDIQFCTSLDGPKNFNDLYRIGTGVKSVYDSVEQNLLSIKDLPIKKGLQMTIGKMHVFNYQKGMIVSWIKDIERLGIDSFELVPVMSNDMEYKIDLDNNFIRQNYIQLCNDYADYCLDTLTKEQTPKVMSRIFVSLILHIIKRIYQEECSAGYSFCVSPELMGYPCHVCADNDSFSVKFNENFRENILIHKKFQEIKNLERCDIESCKRCIAKNVCSYVCKGLCDNKECMLSQERCLMMNIFLRKVIIFLADNYYLYHDNIRNNLVNLNCGSMDA